MHAPEAEMLKKIAFIADYEGRSVNSYILMLVRNAIKDFEGKHGTIEGSVSQAENVKPSRNKSIQLYRSRN